MIESKAKETAMQMKISFPGHSRVDAEFDGYLVPTDQPLGRGGDGLSPGPFDYFLSSIGTCAGFFVLRFLQQRQISTDGVHLSLDTERDPESGLVTRIRLQVHLPKDFPVKYERAILAAVNLCSVKKHLENPPQISTEVRIGARKAAGVSAA